MHDVCVPWQKLYNFNIFFIGIVNLLIY
jgi:hypothetical protein